MDKKVLDRLISNVILSRVIGKKLSDRFSVTMGQEAIAVGFLEACEKSCFVYGTDPAHYIGNSGLSNHLMESLRDSHSFDINSHFFSSRGCQALSVAYGHAFSIKEHGIDSRVVCFVNDTDFQRGTAYEVLLLLSICPVPLSIVISYNGDTPLSRFFPHIVSGYRSVPLTFVPNLQAHKVINIWRRAVEYFEKIKDDHGIFYVDCSRITIGSSYDPIVQMRDDIGVSVVNGMCAEVEEQLSEF